MFNLSGLSQSVSGAFDSGKNALEQAKTYYEKVRGTIFADQKLFPQLPDIKFINAEFGWHYDVYVTDEVVSCRKYVSQHIIPQPTTYFIEFNVCDIQMNEPVLNRLAEDVERQAQTVNALVNNNLSKAVIKKMEQAKSIMNRIDTFTSQAVGTVQTTQNLLNKYLSAVPASQKPTQKASTILKNLKGIMVDIVIDGELCKNAVITSADYSGNTSQTGIRRFRIDFKEISFVEEDNAQSLIASISQSPKKYLGASGSKILSKSEVETEKSSILYASIFG